MDFKLHDIKHQVYFIKKCVIVKLVDIEIVFIGENDSTSLMYMQRKRMFLWNVMHPATPRKGYF